MGFFLENVYKVHDDPKQIPTLPGIGEAVNLDGFPESVILNGDEFCFRNESGRFLLSRNGKDISVSSEPAVAILKALDAVRKPDPVYNGRDVEICMVANGLMAEEKTFKLIVAGSRTFFDYKAMEEKLDHLLKNRIFRGEKIEIVSGGARGADELAETYAGRKGYSFTCFPAEWDKLGKSAGPIRNQRMVDYGDAAAVFSVNRSSGSEDLLSKAEHRGLPIRAYDIVFAKENVLEHRSIITEELPDRLAAAITHTSLPYLMHRKDEENYATFRKAKYNGDRKAAYRAVERVLKADKMLSLYSLLDPEKKTYLVSFNRPDGKNALPEAYAQHLAEYLAVKGIRTETMSMHNLTPTHNAGAGKSERAAKNITVGGTPPPPGSQVLIIDDTFTSGRSILSIMEKLEECDIRAVTTLASSRYGARLRPTEEAIDALTKAGVSFAQLEEEGIQWRKMTGAEMKSIQSDPTTDKMELFRKLYLADTFAGMTARHITSTKNEEKTTQGIKVK